MHTTWRYLATLTTLCAAVLPGCSSDSEPTPAGEAGSASGGSQAAAGSGARAGGPAGGNAAGGSGSAGNGAGNGGVDVNAGTSAGGNTNGGSSAGGEPGGAGSGGEAPSGDVIEECLDAPVLEDTRTEALSLEGEGLLLGIVRRVDPDSLGTSGTTPWLPQRFALERGVVASCISEAPALSYTASRHNFDDSMRATSGAETWLFKQMREDYDQPTTWTVEGRVGDALSWGPVTLSLLGCTLLDADTSCADTYD